jgi:hypothetical protein
MSDIEFMKYDVYFTKVKDAPGFCDITRKILEKSLNIESVNFSEYISENEELVFRKIIKETFKKFEEDDQIIVEISGPASHGDYCDYFCIASKKWYTQHKYHDWEILFHVSDHDDDYTI